MTAIKIQFLLNKYMDVEKQRKGGNASKRLTISIAQVELGNKNKNVYTLFKLKIKFVHENIC